MWIDFIEIKVKPEIVDRKEAQKERCIQESSKRGERQWALIVNNETIQYFHEEEDARIAGHLAFPKVDYEVIKVSKIVPEDVNLIDLRKFISDLIPYRAEQAPFYKDLNDKILEQEGKRYAS